MVRTEYGPQVQRPKQKMPTKDRTRGRTTVRGVERGLICLLLPARHVHFLKIVLASREPAQGALLLSDVASTALFDTGPRSLYPQFTFCFQIRAALPSSSPPVDPGEQGLDKSMGSPPSSCRWPRWWTLGSAGAPPWRHPGAVKGKAGLRGPFLPFAL